MSPTPSLIEPPNQHHTEEHAGTFLPEVKPQAYEYIAARNKEDISIKPHFTIVLLHIRYIEATFSSREEEDDQGKEGRKKHRIC